MAETKFNQLIENILTPREQLKLSIPSKKFLMDQ